MVTAWPLAGWIFPPPKNHRLHDSVWLGVDVQFLVIASVPEPAAEQAAERVEYRESIVNAAGDPTVPPQVNGAEMPTPENVRSTTESAE